VTGTTARATVPVLRALLDQARSKDFRSGVLGVRAQPEWSGAAEFPYNDALVRVVPCVSALAVREALTGRARDQWLVVLTDRSEEDLGTGVLSHLLWHRLRTPDPWDAVRHRFAAKGIDPALIATSGDREIAVGLLAAAPSSGWPPAPAGVLTRDHAFGAVAATRLELTDPVIDAASVLGWTARPQTASRIADLRSLSGDALTDAVLAWAASRAGAASVPLRHLLRTGDSYESVPVGLIAGLLAGARDGADGQTRQPAREALIRLEPRFGGSVPSATALLSWSAESASAILDLLGDRETRQHGEKLLAHADELLDSVQGRGLAGASDLLPAGLARRLSGLADALRSAAANGPISDPDLAQVSAVALAAVEQAWTSVATHRLADTDSRTAAFRAAVRLARWLAADSRAVGATLPSLLAQYRDQDAWVDSAVADATPGVSDPDLGSGLAAVLTGVRLRRTAHNRAFAAALARYTADDPVREHGKRPDVWYVEELLPEVILPLARHAPVLLLVLDGMSAAAATEVVGDVLSRTAEGWAEALLPGQDRRAAALAVLPTLTEFSRTSLLSGELRGGGGQDLERQRFKDLAVSYGVDNARLFHKKSLDSSRPGFAVADDVAAAISDVTNQPLVACVLNTIDDTLDRNDPDGVEWSAATVKHLLPLLDRARHAGRVVVLTADHGHIVERRQTTQRPYAGISSGRSRSVGDPARDDEVLVTGRRVLPDGTAVLAVDDTLRYGPLKAGYHGGAAPAEAVIPVAVLVSGAVPEETGLRLAPPQEPAWWLEPPAPVTATGGLAFRPAAVTGTGTASVPTASAKGRGVTRRQADDPVLTLFDEPEPDVTLPSPSAEPAYTVTPTVLSSKAYAAQKRIAGRVSVSDVQVRRLLDALLTASGHRLAPAAAATALQVSPVALRGAVLHVQRLLNVEGYPVLRVDADGSTLILDEDLLREQFGVGS
jgi:hypothetical protein